MFDGFRAEQVTPDVDLVIVGNAISRGNVELEAVLDSKRRYCSLPEAIRDQFLWDRRSVVVAGTHGKTTTTSLLASVLADAGRDPSASIGGICANFGSSYRLGEGPEFVIEGDEYDSAYFDKTAKFLKYLPDVAVVGNVEFDHADIYPDLETIVLAFRRFLALVPRGGLTVLGVDSEHAQGLRPFAKSRVVTVGLGQDADWQAHAVRSVEGITRFEVTHGGAAWATVDTTLLGLHNVRNILATIAVAADPRGGSRGHHRRHTAVPRCEAADGTAGRGGRRQGLRRLRTPSDRDPRNARRRTRGTPGGTHLGHLRAALGDVVPPHLPAGVHRGVRRGRRGHPGGSVPVEPAG